MKFVPNMKIIFEKGWSGYIKFIVFFLQGGGMSGRGGDWVGIYDLSYSALKT